MDFWLFRGYNNFILIFKSSAADFAAIFKREGFGNRKDEDDLKYISGFYWNRGGREINQDSLALQQVATSNGKMLLAVVSDGIGGLAEGENASGYISEKLIERFYRELIPLVGKLRKRKLFERSIIRCFYEIQQAFVRYGKEREIMLGATVSLLLLWNRKYLVFHLGDSRIYFYRGKKRRLLTRDHSDGRNGLTKCMGSFPFQKPDIQFGRIYGKCGFLLCSDGFYRKQGEENFALLSPAKVGEAEQIEKRLGEMAKFVLKKGEKDNMSAVYVKVC